MNKIEYWLPQEPWQGPPLPEFLKIFWPWYKEPGEAAAGVAIEVLGHQSPLSVDEGRTYSVRVTVTNASTKGGVPWEARLGLRTRASGNGEVFIPTTDESALFAAGESKAFTYTMTIPWMGAGSGVIDAVVTSPPGGILASDTEPLTIVAVAIVYGATVTIG